MTFRKKMKYLVGDTIVAKVDNKSLMVKIKSIDDDKITVLDDRINRHIIYHNDVEDIMYPKDAPIVVEWATYDDDYEKEYGIVQEHFVDKKHGHPSYRIKFSNGKVREVYHYQVKACANTYSPAEYELRCLELTIQ